jgi:Transposase IS116/IS110/IS902 family
LPPSEPAAQLKGLRGHRYELLHACTRRKNKLTALCDQLFPEVPQVWRDPNSPTALRVRERYPRAAAVATADLEALWAVKGRTHPGRKQLASRQTRAAHSIGVHDPLRLQGLVFAQEQLMHELQLLERHLQEIACKEEHILQASREGRILRSIPGIGVHAAAAAALLAAIGNIDNFPNAAALKAYFGWAPAIRQSGVSVNSTPRSRAGERPMKAMMYRVAMKAIQDPGPWADLYERLVERGCSYDERRREYIGKKRILGRIAGQMSALLYGLLRSDVELRARPPAHEPLPEPLLYDAPLHHAHQTGAYHSMKGPARPARLVRLARRAEPHQERCREPTTQP